MAKHLNSFKKKNKSKYFEISFGAFKIDKK